MQIKSFPSSYSCIQTDVQSKQQQNTIKVITETHTRYSGSSKRGNQLHLCELEEGNVTPTSSKSKNRSCQGIWNTAINVCKGMEAWNGIVYLEQSWVIWAEAQAVCNELMRDKLLRTEEQD